MRKGKRVDCNNVFRRQGNKCGRWGTVKGGVMDRAVEETDGRRGRDGGNKYTLVSQSGYGL